MKAKIFGLLFLFLFQACQIGAQERRVLNEKEISELQSLSTLNLQRAYLMNVFHSDQEIRNKYEFVLLEHGYGTAGFKQYLKEMKSVDQLNLLKIEMYLDLYGHPLKMKQGDEVVDVPCLVIHHFADNKVSEKYFGMFKKSYFSGDLGESIFYPYLRRFYELKYNKVFKATCFGNEIDELILALDVK